MIIIGAFDEYKGTSLPVVFELMNNTCKVSELSFPYLIFTFRFCF